MKEQTFFMFRTTTHPTMKIFISLLSYATTYLKQNPKYFFVFPILWFKLAIYSRSSGSTTPPRDTLPRLDRRRCAASTKSTAWTSSSLATQWMDLSHLMLGKTIH